jgi:hypothetical protein
MIAAYVNVDLQPDINWVGIREICGHDEQMIAGTGTVMAVQLIDRLLVALPKKKGARPIDAMEMTAADRDKILAAIYTRTFGPVVESTAQCSRCALPFDLDFSLKDIAPELQQSDKTSTARRGNDGTFLLPDGRRFRLPTFEDECAVIGVAPDDAVLFLLRKCVLDGDPEVDPGTVQNAMSEVAPIIDMDLAARCPECGAENLVHFDIQSFLLAALEQEKKRLAWEVHRLACAYGWSLSEILGLPRSVRRSYVSIIESEMPSRRRFSV